MIEAMQAKAAAHYMIVDRCKQDGDAGGAATYGQAADLYAQAAAIISDLCEALREAEDIAGKHRRIALDYKYGTKVAEKLPTDREWYAFQDRCLALATPSANTGKD